MLGSIFLIGHNRMTMHPARVWQKLLSGGNFGGKSLSHNIILFFITEI
jgi:hypothetical protein